MKKPAYLFFGPQGSGKTTQAKMIAQALQLPLFDTGDQLRLIAGQETAVGQQVAAMMERGELMPNELLNRVLSRFLADNSQEKGIVIDGFPRTLDQCKLLDDLVHQYNWEVIAVFITITDEEAKDRLAKRVVTTNGQEQTRSDDQPEIVAKRLANFKAQTLPAIRYIEQKYRLITIDGQPDIETVQASIQSSLL